MFPRLYCRETVNRCMSTRKIIALIYNIKDTPSHHTTGMSLFILAAVLWDGKSTSPYTKPSLVLFLFNWVRGIGSRYLSFNVLSTLNSVCALCALRFERQSRLFGGIVIPNSLTCPKAHLRVISGYVLDVLSLYFLSLKHAEVHNPEGQNLTWLLPDMQRYTTPKGMTQHF